MRRICVKKGGRTALVKKESQLKMSMFRQNTKSVDPQELLPLEFQAQWAVVPKFELYQLFVAGFVIGAGAMASILDITVGPAYLWYGFPLALAYCVLQAMILGRFADRRLRELDESRAKNEKEK